MALKKRKPTLVAYESQEISRKADLLRIQGAHS
jgi:hypothetical protein